MIRNICKSHIAFIVIGIFLSAFTSLTALTQPGEILDKYIKQGLENNHALKQKELNLEKSLKALQEANGLFYPSASLEAQYFLANGGRSIELPVGNMLNGVYSSLNSLLEDHGQPGGFPQISNEEIEFLPNDYHDTKLRVILPLVNTEIYYNRKIKKEMISVSQAEANVYKRELVKDIKTAYFRYLQAVKVAEAYNSALELVQEARRVNKKLVDNQMAGPEKLYRIDAELSQVKAQLIKAENDKNTAASYFNFLINQQLRTDVLTDSSLLNFTGEKDFGFDPAGIPQNREELVQLSSALKSTDYYYKMKKSYLLPTISNITDIGYQGYAYTFDHEQQYVMNTINLSWPIFSGFQNRNKVAQAKIESEALRNRLNEAAQQIELQSRVAEDNYETSLKAEEANKSSLISSKEYLKVVNKQYAVGQKSLLDLLDARNQLTSSQINYTVSHFETLIRSAELERANASFDLSLLTNRNPTP
jgi:outer membrane protein